MLFNTKIPIGSKIKRYSGETFTVIDYDTDYVTIQRSDIAFGISWYVANTNYRFNVKNILFKRPKLI